MKIMTPYHHHSPSWLVSLTLTLSLRLMWDSFETSWQSLNCNREFVSVPVSNRKTNWLFTDQHQQRGNSQGVIWPQSLFLDTQKAISRLLHTKRSPQMCNSNHPKCPPFKAHQIWSFGCTTDDEVTNMPPGWIRTQKVQLWYMCHTVRANMCQLHRRGVSVEDHPTAKFTLAL